jgi:hypothetical protein
MKYINFFRLLTVFGMGLALGVVLFNLPSIVGAQGAIDTTFTYQGRLLRSGAYADGISCNFRFGLYSVPTGGTPLGTGNQTINGVNISDGYFTVDLNFGDVFDGSKRYLQIAVQCPGDASFTTLAGRIELRAAPYALHAESVNWADILNLPAGFADGQDGLDAFSCLAGQMLSSTGGGWQCAPAPNDHGNLNGLLDDDHPQYLHEDGDTLQGNLDAAGNRITGLPASFNPGDPIVHDQAASGDLGGNYPDPIVTGLQGNPVVGTTPITGQVLAWDGSQWEPGSFLPSGPAGGDLTGLFPNPDIASDVVGMNELNTPIGYNAGSLSLASFDINDDVYFFPTGSSFTPNVDGQCLVIVDAQIRSTGSSSVNAATLRTAKRETGQPDTNDNSTGFTFDDSSRSPTASASFVWNVFNGRPTRFGCYLRINDGNVADDETLFCRVSYICQ